ncbi:DMT family transporter [Burkholderia cenocepacia]|nr:DMT family transporter [Burkholderia cenocepacia]
MHTIVKGRYAASASVHIVALLFGLVGIFGKLAGTGEWITTSGRALFASIALVTAAILRKELPPGSFGWRNLRTFMISGTFISIHWVTFFIAARTSGVAIAAFGFAGFPAFSTVMECIFLRERVHRAEWILLCFTVTGLGLIAPPIRHDGSATIGMLWGLSSGVSFAVVLLINRHAAARLTPLQLACGQCLAATLITLPAAVTGLQSPTASAWCWIATLGVLCTAVPYLLLISGLASLNARTASMILSLEPAYAMAFGWMLCAQVPDRRLLSGAAIVVVSTVATGRLQSCRSSPSSISGPPLSQS